MKNSWTIFLFRATIRPNHGRSMRSAPPVKEVVAVKIGLKAIVRKIGRAKIDWNFWLQVGTFLATLYGALK